MFILERRGNLSGISKMIVTLYNLDIILFCARYFSEALKPECSCFRSEILVHLLVICSRVDKLKLICKDGKRTMEIQSRGLETQYVSLQISPYCVKCSPVCILTGYVCPNTIQTTDWVLELRNKSVKKFASPNNLSKIYELINRRVNQRFYFIL